MDENSKEAKEYQKYASMMRYLDCRIMHDHLTETYQCMLLGEYPYEMHTAADCLIEMATGLRNMNPVLDASWLGP